MRDLTIGPQDMYEQILNNESLNWIDYYWITTVTDWNSSF